MIGTDPILNIYLEKQVIATITLQDDQLSWQYQPDWQQWGYAISPHMPLQDAITSLNVQRFLRNYLPEGHGLEILLQSAHLSRDNTFALIRKLGLDMPGALVALPAEDKYPKDSDFRIIKHEELEQRLDHGNQFELIVWDEKPRLSVAGVQDKINVVLNEKDQLGFGEGQLCSTHILKFEKQKLSHLVVNEYLSMRLAKQCGLDVANAALLRFGSHPALLVKRFDRKYVSQKSVMRRHVIDGCQALNLPPEYKYERNFGKGADVAHIREGVSLDKLFEFSDQCDNPILTKQKILDWVLFNVLIFNYDAHGKNISFFIGTNGLTLAPFYDLVNVKMCPDFEHDMAMGLGDEFDGDMVHAYQLADFSDSCGLPRSMVANRLKVLAELLQTHLPLEIEKVPANKAEEIYLSKYQHMVIERCQHLLQQVNDIVSIVL